MSLTRQTPQQQNDEPSWWERMIGAGGTGGQYGTAGAMGREGAVQAMHQAAYNLGANAPRDNFNGSVYRNVGSRYASSMFEAQHGAGWGGRYNASGQQLIYTSPTRGMSVGEAGAYNGMADRTMVEARYKTRYNASTGQGGVANVSQAASQIPGMTETLTPHVGKQGPGRLWSLFGEHPYSMTQQVGKGATDAGAGAIRVPSATGGEQIDIIPRNNRANAIKPRTVTPYDNTGTAGRTVRANSGAPNSAISGMGLDTSPNTPGRIPHGPGSTLRPVTASDPTPPGRASSVRYGALGGGITSLGTDLYRMANGEDISLGQVALDTGVGTAVGAGSALATDALIAAGRGATSAGGIVGGVIEGGMSAWNNANAYANGDISGGQAIANTVVDTGVGVGAGMAGAAAGAALGSIIPGAGTLVGAGLGFLGGMAGSYLAHALADKTGAAAWAKEQLGAGLDWTGEKLGQAGSAIADGAAWVGNGLASAGSAAMDGISSAGSAIADGAGKAWDFVTSW